MCYHCLLELETKVREVCTITEKAPTRAFSLLKAAITGYSRPSFMTFASQTQIHIERPWGQRPLGIVS